MSMLEKTTHICLIAVCCISLAMLLEKRFSAHRTPSNGSASMVGRSLALKGVTWARSPKNLVIALMSKCKFCNASLPLYRRISEIKQKHGGDLSVFAVSPETLEVTRGFLSKSGITVDQVLQSALEPLGIVGTPTVLVVDSRGVVEQEFRGRLADAQERVLVAMLDRSSSSPGASETK